MKTEPIKKYKVIEVGNRCATIERIGSKYGEISVGVKLVKEKQHNKIVEKLQEEKAALMAHLSVIDGHIEDAMFSCGMPLSEGQKMLRVAEIFVEKMPLVVNGDVAKSLESRDQEMKYQGIHEAIKECQFKGGEIYVADLKVFAERTRKNKEQDHE